MTTVDGTVSFDTVFRALRKYGENPSGFLALNTGNEYFATPDVDGFIVYRRAGRYLVQFGGPFAAPQHRRALLNGFLEFAGAEQRRVVAIQLQRPDAELYVDSGFTVNQVGASYSVRLPDFTMRGAPFMKLRNKVSRARRSGLTVAEVRFETHRAAIAAIDSEWLSGKGRHVKEIEFLVGQCGGAAQSHRRLFVGQLGETPVAYISYSPVYGSRTGWLHDLSRRKPDVPPGVMEAINLHATEAFRREGAEWLHFGFTPFTSLSAANEMDAASRITTKFIRFLAEHGGAVYPAASQLAYKEKWAPHLILPEYLAFYGRARFGAIWQILRVTKSI